MSCALLAHSLLRQKMTTQPVELLINTSGTNMQI